MRLTISWESFKSSGAVLQPVTELCVDFYWLDEVKENLRQVFCSSWFPSHTLVKTLVILMFVCSKCRFLTDNDKSASVQHLWHKMKCVNQDLKLQKQKSVIAFVSIIVWHNNWQVDEKRNVILYWSVL